MACTADAQQGVFPNKVRIYKCFPNVEQMLLRCGSDAIRGNAMLSDVIQCFMTDRITDKHRDGGVKLSNMFDFFFRHTGCSKMYLDVLQMQSDVTNM